MPIKWVAFDFILLKWNFLQSWVLLEVQRAEWVNITQKCIAAWWQMHYQFLTQTKNSANWCAQQISKILIHSKLQEPTFKSWYVGWLVIWGLTALSDSISVYIGPSPKEREKEKRKDRWEKKCPNKPPTSTYCKRNRPLPYCHPN